MKKINFVKMHGLGNSYIYIDGFKNQIKEKNLRQLAIQLSKPCKGIGADGLIHISPSSCATVKMRIFNKDGSEGKNCGNGLRCVAMYVFNEGLCKTKELTIETLSGIAKATILNHNFTESTVLIDMGIPELSRNSIPMIGMNSSVIAEPFVISGLTLKLTAVSMGNPHAVFFIDDINRSPHKILGPQIETDHRFPEGINVEFIQVESPTSLHFRVWERGSGVTQACGTGACAAVVASVLNGHCKKNEDVIVHLEGGNLTIRWNQDGNVHMTGTATTIATGHFFDLQ